MHGGGDAEGETGVREGEGEKEGERQRGREVGREGGREDSGRVQQVLQAAAGSSFVHQEVNTLAVVRV